MRHQFEDIIYGIAMSIACHVLAAAIVLWM